MCVYFGYTQKMDKEFAISAIEYTSKMLKIPFDEVDKLGKDVQDGLIMINKQLLKMVDKVNRTGKNPFTDDDNENEKWK